MFLNSGNNCGICPYFLLTESLSFWELWNGLDIKSQQQKHVLHINLCATLPRKTACLYFWLYILLCDSILNHMYNTGLQTEIHQGRKSSGFSMELMVKLHNIFRYFQQSLVFEEGISHKLPVKCKTSLSDYPIPHSLTFSEKAAVMWLMGLLTDDSGNLFPINFQLKCVSGQKWPETFPQVF